MEKQQKRIKLFSIIGSSLFAAAIVYSLALPLLYILDVYGYNGYVYNSGTSIPLFFQCVDTFFNVCIFVSFGFILAIKRSKYLFVIPSGIGLLKCVADFVEFYIFTSTEYLVDLKSVNVMSIILSLLFYLSIIVVVCIADLKESKAIKYTWFIPPIIYMAMWTAENAGLFLELSSIINLMFVDINFIEPIAEIILYLVLYCVLPIIYHVGCTVAFVMLCLYLKTSNQCSDKNTVPEAPKVQTPPVEPQYRPEPLYRPEPQYRPQPMMQQAKPQYHQIAPQQRVQSQDIENLKNLKELLDAGIITQEEFNQKKKEILNL